MLVFYLFLCLLATGSAIDCKVPNEFPPSEMPSVFPYEGENPFIGDGNLNSCSLATIAKFDANSNPFYFFTFNQIICNKTTGKYDVDLGSWGKHSMDLPSFIGCVGVQISSGGWCAVHSDDVFPTDVFILTGMEDFCPSSSRAAFANGTKIQSLSCDPNKVHLTIVSEEGGTTTEIVYDAKDLFMCEPNSFCHDYCDVPSLFPPTEMPSEFPYEGDSPFAADGSISCPRKMIAKFNATSNPFYFTPDGPVVCNKTTGKYDITFVVGDFFSIDLPSYINCVGDRAPGKASCPVRSYDVFPNWVSIVHGFEDFCPINARAAFANGTKIKSLNCDAAGSLTVTSEEGEVWIQTRFDDPDFFKCDPKTCDGPLPVNIANFPPNHVLEGEPTNTGGVLTCINEIRTLQLTPTSPAFTLPATGPVLKCEGSNWQYGGANFDENIRISCAIAVGNDGGNCLIKLKQNGTANVVRVYNGKEQICGEGKMLKLEDGSLVETANCTTINYVDIFTVTTINGIQSTLAQYSIVECVPKPEFNCSMPTPVDAGKYPPQWTSQAATRDGEYLDCDSNYYVVSKTATSVPFTLGGYFKCNRYTGKWNYAEGKFDELERIGCGKRTDVNMAPYCLVNLKQENNGAKATVSIYPGNEQICSSDKILKYDDGRLIETLSCNASGLTISTSDGNTATVDALTTQPVLTCVTKPQLPCPVPTAVPTAQFPAPWTSNGAPTNDGQYLDCLDIFVVRQGDTSNTYTMGGYFKCHFITGKWRYAETAILAPQQISCGKRTTAPLSFCSVYLKQQGTSDKELISIYSGGEKICADGTMMQYDDGRFIEKMTCTAPSVTVWTLDGAKETVVMPVVKCAPAPNLPCLAPAVVPIAQFPAPWTYDSDPKNDGDYLDCEPPNFVAKLTATSKAFTVGAYFKCNHLTGKWHNSEEKYASPAQISCGKRTTSTLTYCQIILKQDDGATMGISLYPGSEQVCATGQSLLFADNRTITTITCSATGLSIVSGGTTSTPYNPTLKCTVPPTTTTIATTTTVKTTTPTTTTLKPDSVPSSAQLRVMTAYYNYGNGVHAFCSDAACVTTIQSNGIGYDMTNGKVIIGRVVTPSAISAVLANCPKGGANLRLLGFEKVGKAYIHNLQGAGLQQGYVSIVSGSCGATKGIKRWRSRYTDDMMYGVDFEWNDYYKGMVQNNGAFLFYMWENS